MCLTISASRYRQKHNNWIWSSTDLPESHTRKRKVRLETAEDLLSTRLCNTNETSQAKDLVNCGQDRIKLYKTRSTRLLLTTIGATDCWMALSESCRSVTLT